MKLAQLTLVTALVFAAAILFPVRRAQAAFALHACAASGLVCVPRMKLRRRPGGPRTVLKSTLRSDRVDDPSRRTVAAGPASAETIDQSDPSADAASTSEMAHWQDTRDKREAAGAAQAHVSAHAGAATAATLDCVSESSPRIFPPAALLETAVASPPPFVIPQVEREVPVPPPKFATR